MGIIITDKTDNKKKHRRSYEDYEELPETQNPETTTEEPQNPETTTEEPQNPETTTEEPQNPEIPFEDKGKAED